MILDLVAVLRAELGGSLNRIREEECWKLWIAQDCRRYRAFVAGRAVARRSYRYCHVLTNGIEVKLQRNALSVIEAPTGNEDDDDLDFDNTQRNGSDMTSEDTLKQRRQRSSRSSHKTTSWSLSSDSQSKSSGFTPQNMKVDLSKLDMPALLKYWRHFDLADAIPNPSKEHLIDIVQRHFMSQQMDELQVVVGFVQAAKRMKKACKLQSKEARNTDLNCIS
ncbi:unnamed protein product [Brassica napus]|uniref:(rape) hypothetical protein n=1 Tax=Brassica napus TaxID=3708 RepID=A0A816PM66_BRANA|nr:unnamed protein product [Brassica napus]